MNRLELIERIQLLIPANCSKRDLRHLERQLIEKESHVEIFNEWSNNEDRLRKEQWHQFVRLAIDFPKVQRMYSRIRRLVYKYRNHNEYFQANFQNNRCLLPDRASQLESLMTICDDFFNIFQKIYSQINFDFGTGIFTNRTIHGRVNWDLTFRKSSTPFPLQFETVQNQKNFVTSENILLILCVIWLNKRSMELLQTKFSDPLDESEIKILLGISNKTKNILMVFPFSEVTKSAVDVSSIELSHPYIYEMEKNILKRINDGKIQNLWYGKLVEWFRKFRSFDFADLKRDNLNNNFLLEATKNLDSLYEIWIFFEMIHRFSRYIDVDLHLGDTPQFFEFDSDGQSVQIFYEKRFSPDDQKAWALEHTPDFSVMSQNDIVAVFDAKNWKQTPRDEETPPNKILSYITNLDCGFGVIFWPKKSSTFKFPPNDTVVPKFHNNLKISTITLSPYEEDFSAEYESVFKELFSEIISQLKISIKA